MRFGSKYACTLMPSAAIVLPFEGSVCTHVTCGAACAGVTRVVPNGRSRYSAVRICLGIPDVAVTPGAPAGVGALSGVGVSTETQLIGLLGPAIGGAGGIAVVVCEPPPPHAVKRPENIPAQIKPR